MYFLHKIFPTKGALNWKFSRFAFPVLANVLLTEILFSIRFAKSKEDIAEEITNEDNALIEYNKTV